MSLKSLRCVLILDDDPIQLELTASFLAKRGVASILRAGDGQSAKKMVALHGAQIDLVISDLNMPDFDGVEFITYLKDQHFVGAFVIVSGAPPAVVKAAAGLATAFQLDFVGHFRKPLNFSDLDAALSTIDGHA